MIGTTFGTIHSYTDLGLLQQRVDVAPAIPKTSFVDIPGADGSKDLTEALGVGVKYGDREIIWTFALYPGADWYATQKEVSNELNGLACHIILDADPDYYYEGRVIVDSYASDRLLRQITVRAICRPWKKKVTGTTVERDDLGTSYKTLTLNNERQPVIPTITVEQETTLSFGGSTFTVSAGAHAIPDIRLSPGANTLKAKVASGTGSISVTYTEGAL